MRPWAALNLLLINHSALETNSAYHVLGHAQALAAAGHEVCAGMSKLQGLTPFDIGPRLRVTRHRDLLEHGGGFRDGRQADIIHVWTPREHVRQFTEAYRARHGAGTLIVHLEDPEAVVFERYTGHSLKEAQAVPQPWPSGLISPAHGEAFLNSAAGYTVVHSCLQSEVPAGRRWLELVPVLDSAFFDPQQDTQSLRAELGLSDRTPVVAFHGNDHPAVAADLRCLYEAMERLFRNGWNGVFLRTGHVDPERYRDLSFRSDPRCLELGFVERHRMPALIAIASVVVQPGMADDFNAHRLPAKIPEYLLMGRPLVMGRTNIAQELLAHEAIKIVETPSPIALADALLDLLNNPEEASHMGQRGRKFALERFSAAKVTPPLESFYQECLRTQRG